MVTDFFPHFKDFFFLCGPFKFLLDLLQYCFYFMFCFFGQEARKVLAPRPGTEPTPPALGGEVLTSRLPGSPYSTLNILPSDFSFCKFSFYINTKVFHN